MKLNRSTVFMVFLFLLQGCATTYQGPAPNLSLTGIPAQGEIKKISFMEGYWAQGSGFKMGPEERRYTVESVQPFVQKVSPAAIEKLDSAQNYLRAGRIAIGVGDVALLLAIFAANSQSQQVLVPLFLVGIGTGAGLEIKAFSEFSSASEQYNKDLRQKLSPSMAFNFDFD